MTNETDPRADAAAGPALQFPAGTTAEDIAAVVALLAATAGTDSPAAPGAPRLWGVPGRSVRRPITPSRSGWWLSQLP